jgi:hypothetical protein
MSDPPLHAIIPAMTARTVREAAHIIKGALNPFNQTPNCAFYIKNYHRYAPGFIENRVIYSKVIYDNAIL